MKMKPRLDRAAIMRDAHKRFRDGTRLGLGWTFGQCLSTAWAAAKVRGAFAEAAAARGERLEDSARKADSRQNAPSDLLCLGIANHVVKL